MLPRESGYPVNDPPPPTLRAPIREQLRRAWTRIRGGDLTPSRAAFSVAIGAFIGVQPTPGLHIFLVLGTCLALGLDGAVAYLAANISIPPVAPFLWFSAIQLGSWTLHGHTIPLTLEAARTLARHPGHSLAVLACGSVELGALLAVVLGVVAFAVVSANRAGKEQRVATPSSNGPNDDDAIDRTATRFRDASKSRGTYYYVRGKLGGDPSTRAVAALAPLGNVVDLGCGRGQLAVFLLESGSAQSVRGVDWDEAKVAIANRAADGLDAVFHVGDVRDAGGERADTVLLIDVLHYFDRATQDDVLTRAAARVAPGGRLVVREADLGRGWRSWATRIEESVFTAIRFNRGERVVFRRVDREWVPLLEAQGFQCDVRPCWGRTPFSNVLLVAKKKASAS